jgi:hypothetical protein
MTVNDELLQLRELREIFTNTERTISMFRAMPPRAPSMVRCLRRLSGRSPATDSGTSARCKRAPRQRQASPSRCSQCPQLDDGCGYTSDASDALSSASTPARYHSRSKSPVESGLDFSDTDPGSPFSGFSAHSPDSDAGTQFEADPFAWDEPQDGGEPPSPPPAETESVVPFAWCDYRQVWAPSRPKRKLDQSSWSRHQHPLRLSATHNFHQRVI